VEDAFAGGTLAFGYAFAEHWNVEIAGLALSIDGEGGAPDLDQTAVSVNFLNIYAAPRGSRRIGLRVWAG
jgi:hypothetical protein